MGERVVRIRGSRGIQDFLKSLVHEMESGRAFHHGHQGRPQPRPLDLSAPHQLNPGWRSFTSSDWAGIIGFAPSPSDDPVAQVTASWTVPTLGRPNFLSDLAPNAPQGPAKLSLNMEIAICAAGDPSAAHGVRAGVILGGVRPQLFSSQVSMNSYTGQSFAGVPPQGFFYLVEGKGPAALAPDTIFFPRNGVADFDGPCPGDTVLIELQVQGNTATATCSNVVRGAGRVLTLSLRQAAQGQTAHWGVTTAGPAWNRMPRFGNVFFDEATYLTRSELRRSTFHAHAKKETAPVFMQMAGSTQQPNGAALVQLQSPDGTSVDVSAPFLVQSRASEGRVNVTATEYPPWVISCCYSGISTLQEPQIDAFSPPTFK